MKIRLTLETEIKKGLKQRHKLQTSVRLTRK